MKRARSFVADMARHPSGLAGGLFIALLVLVALFVGFFPQLDPHVISNDSMAAPSAQYWLGTDELGRSVLAGVLHGTRVSLTVGFFAAIVATLLGVIVGAAAGFYGGWLDTLVMRVAEFFQVIPGFILAAVIVAMTGSGVTQIIAVVGLLSWPQVARVMRGEVLRVKKMEFVDAVRCLGIAEHQVLIGEVIPNALAPVVAVGTLIVGQAILLEASLSFLGLSSAELVSWGRMLNSGQRFLFNAWWLSLFPGAAIFATVLAFNLFGDAIGAVLNPRNSMMSTMANDDTNGAAGAALLQADALTVVYRARGTDVTAVREVSIVVREGESVALVGESGSGKSTVARAMLGLLPERIARIESGRIVLEGRDVTRYNDAQWQAVRGHPVAMVFQDPLSYLNPVMRIGRQIAESVRRHDPATPDVAARVAELLDLVRLPATSIRSYPHELSGGMRQRVLLAIALGCRPKLLIADEPTTALDVTTQAEILALLRDLRQRLGMAMLLISHDLGVVWEECERVYVMFRSRIVESGLTREVFANPAHAYTAGLIKAAKASRNVDGRFETIEGEFSTSND